MKKNATTNQSTIKRPPKLDVNAEVDAEYKEYFYAMPRPASTTPNSHNSGDEPHLAVTPSNRKRRSSSQSSTSQRNNSHASLLLFYSSMPSPDSQSQNNNNNISRRVLQIRSIPYNPGNTRDPSDSEYATKFTPDFYDRIFEMQQRHRNLLAFRLQADPYNVSNRRYSLSIPNGEILACPKETDTYTQTNPSDTICSGHLPRDVFFQDKKYNYGDNNMSGAWPSLIESEPNDHELLSLLQRYDSSAIIAAKYFYYLVCYAERTEKQEYAERWLPSGEYHSKHYIQEAEKVSSILNRIDRGIYEFQELVDYQLYFRVKKTILCRVDLRMIMPTAEANDEVLKLSTSLKPISSKNFDNLELYVNSSGIAERHVPIFFQNPEYKNVFLPVMVQAGKDGYHVAPDADPQHISIPSNMPWAAFKSFNGRKHEPEMFLRYFQILIHELESDGATNFTEIPYYSNVFIPLAKKTYEHYKEEPSALQSVGESCIHDLILQRDFRHPLYRHGPEDLHPGSNLEDFGAILICYDGKFYISADEFSYICFLMHDPNILHTQYIGVHPFWLRDRKGSDEAILTEGWLDVIEVQALNAAANSLEEVQTYKRVMLDNIVKGRSTETIAIKKIEQRFKEIFSKIVVNTIDGTTINIGEVHKRLNDIYCSYKETSRDINIIHDLQCSNSSPRMMG